MTAFETANEALASTYATASVGARCFQHRTLPTCCACFNIYSAGFDSWAELIACAWRTQQAAVLVPVLLSTMAHFLSWAFSCSFERHLASQLGYWLPSFKIGYPVSQLAAQFGYPVWLPSLATEAEPLPQQHSLLGADS